MIILDYDKNENLKLDVPKINKPKKINEKNNCYFVIASIFIIGFLFNINRGLKIIIRIPVCIILTN